MISTEVMAGGLRGAMKKLLSRTKTQEHSVHQLSDGSDSFLQEICDGYYRCSMEGKALLSNPALARLNGYDSVEAFDAVEMDIAQSWYVDPNRRSEFMDKLLAEGAVKDFVSEVRRHKTGERIWVSETARLVKDSEGVPCCYEGTIKDYTDVVQKNDMQQSHRKFSDNMPGVLLQMRWSQENKFTIPFCSHNFTDFTGEERDPLREDASHLFKLLHPDDRDGFISDAERSAREYTKWTSEFRVNRSDGETIWLEVTATPEIEDDGACLWHGFVMDITEKKCAEEKIHRLAYYDALTDLPNRRMLLERLKDAMDHAVASGSHGAVLFLDLDNFKTLNDSKGHAVGDALLCEISARLTGCARDDAFVARLGGDEFVLLLPDLGMDPDEAVASAEQVARSVLDGIGQPWRTEDTLFHCSCSIGGSLFDSADTASYEVLRRADMAMYASKAAGKNCVSFHTAEVEAEAGEKANLMADLRRAIFEDQLDLHYQVQVDSQGKVTGAEALLRWVHPEKGRIPPDEFIPEAEASGAIVPVTRWILKKSFETLEGWQEDPLLSDLRLSINISARQFHEPDFADQIENLIEEHRVDPSRLLLEITEHVLTEDLGHVKKVMAELKDLGVGFSLDDFGTGYSSLTHLRELPFDEVKIDGKFISDLENNDSDRAIIRSIIATAQALKMETVAEWVESAAQRDFLVREACNTMQGFLFGSALPLRKFEQVCAITDGKVPDKPAQGGTQIWNNGVAAGSVKQA